MFFLMAIDRLREKFARELGVSSCQQEAKAPLKSSLIMFELVVERATQERIEGSGDSRIRVV